MAATVTLPPGCTGLDMQDGTRYTATKASHGTIQVADAHAAAINRGYYGSAGIMHAGQRLSFGTRRGQLCVPCNRLWNAWNTSCPRCGAATQERTGE